MQLPRATTAATCAALLATIVVLFGVKRQHNPVPAFDFFGTSLLCQGHEFTRLAAAHTLLQYHTYKTPTKLVSYCGYSFIISGGARYTRFTSLRLVTYLPTLPSPWSWQVHSVKKNQTLRAEGRFVLADPRSVSKPVMCGAHTLPDASVGQQLYFCAAGCRPACQNARKVMACCADRPSRRGRHHAVGLHLAFAGASRRVGKHVFAHHTPDIAWPARVRCTRHHPQQRLSFCILHH